MEPQYVTKAEMHDELLPLKVAVEVLTQQRDSANQELNSVKNWFFSVSAVVIGVALSLFGAALVLHAFNVQAIFALLDK